MPGFRDPMIQLFRKIRRHLLESGKARSYILYALGEILLVVVGILIALSINTWSENRKNAGEARFQMLKLKDNLMADKVRIKEAISKNEVYMANLTFCIRVLYSDTVATRADFMDRFQHMSTTNNFQPTRGAFEGLISSGKIQLITNQGLLDALLTYYNSTSFTSWDSALKDYTRNVIVPFLLSFDHIPNITDALEGVGFIQFDYSKSAVPVKTLEEYKKSQFILNALRYKIQLFEGQKMQYALLLREIDSLILKLDTELAI